MIVEDVTSQGRIDHTVKFPERISPLEFEVVELEPEGSHLISVFDILSGL